MEDKKEKKHSAGSIITTIILLIICFVLLGAILLKMFESKDNIQAFGNRPGMERKENTASNIYVKEIEPETFTRTLKFFGTISDEGDVVSIISKASGYVSQILVEEGDGVEEGDIIGYIDPSQPGAVYKASPVTARISGKIDDISAVLGQYISAGTVFATEKSDVDYVISLSIPEKYIDNLALGGEAVITSTIRSELNTTAHIIEIDDKIDKSTRTIKIKLRPDNIENLIDGLAVTARLTLEKVDNAFTVPTDAITNISDSSYVYVVEDGKTVQKEIKVGSENDSEALVLSGLEKGDKVVIEGTVGEGTSVNILER